MDNKRSQSPVVSRHGRMGACLPRSASSGYARLEAGQLPPATWRRVARAVYRFFARTGAAADRGLGVLGLLPRETLEWHVFEHCTLPSLYALGLTNARLYHVVGDYVSLAFETAYRDNGASEFEIDHWATTFGQTLFGICNSSVSRHPRRVSSRRRASWMASTLSYQLFREPSCAYLDWYGARAIAPATYNADMVCRVGSDDGSVGAVRRVHAGESTSPVSQGLLHWAAHASRDWSDAQVVAILDWMRSPGVRDTDLALDVALLHESVPRSSRLDRDVSESVFRGNWASGTADMQRLTHLLVLLVLGRPHLLPSAGVHLDKSTLYSALACRAKPESFAGPRDFGMLPSVEYDDNGEYELAMPEHPDTDELLRAHIDCLLFRAAMMSASVPVLEHLLDAGFRAQFDDEKLWLVFETSDAFCQAFFARMPLAEPWTVLTVLHYWQSMDTDDAAPMERALRFAVAEEDTHDDAMRTAVASFIVTTLDECAAQTKTIRWARERGWLDERAVRDEIKPRIAFMAYRGLARAIARGTKSASDLVQTDLDADMLRCQCEAHALARVLRDAGFDMLSITPGDICDIAANLKKPRLAPADTENPPPARDRGHFLAAPRAGRVRYGQFRVRR